MNVKTILSNLLIFATGAAIGSVVTWKIVKTKYDQIMDDEAKSLKEYYSRKYTPTEDAESDICEEDSDMETAEQIITENGYTNYGTKKEATRMERPKVIPPEEFGETDYETVSLTHYADGILTDEMDEPIDDIDNIVGADYVTHFGEYEDDSVFVRNDRLKRDYEILRDSRSFFNVSGREYPHEVEE